MKKTVEVGELTVQLYVSHGYSHFVLADAVVSSFVSSVTDKDKYRDIR